MKNRFYTGLFMLFISVQAWGQQKLKDLKIGDDISGYTFPKVVNSNKNTLAIKDLKGKYVILDLWSTYCSNCIEGFPHMQELQEKLKDKLQVVLVNVASNDNKEKIDRILAIQKKNSGTTINLPISLYDESLHQAFPSKSVSTYIIVDPNGKICAIADPEVMTFANIETLLRDGSSNFQVKGDMLTWAQYKSPKPLLMQPEYKTDKIIINSSLTGYTGGIGTSFLKQNEKGETVGLVNLNNPLSTYYAMAYPQVFEGTLGGNVFETKTPYPEYDPVNHSGVFTFDFYMSANYSEEKQKQALRNELDLAFGFVVTKENRAFPCLVAKKNANLRKCNPRYKKQEDNLEYFNEIVKNKLPIYIHGTTDLSVLFDKMKMNEMFQTKTLISELLPDEKFDLDFPAGFDFKNKDKILKFFHDKGFDLSVETRELPVVVFRDKEEKAK